MKPYYDAHGITIYHGDCREVDAWNVDFATMVTDPPYGMAFVSGQRQGRSRPIRGDMDTRVRDEVLATWVPRPALVFATWKAPLPAGTREVLVWDKVVGLGALDIPWGSSWEAICVIGHGWVGKREHGVLHYALPSAAPERKMHPTPKPVRLMQELIRKCPEAGAIVDPFAGSGSTMCAARNLGRRAIGVELDERYCEEAAQRLERAREGVSAT